MMLHYRIGGFLWWHSLKFLTLLFWLDSGGAIKDIRQTYGVGRPENYDLQLQKESHTFLTADFVIQAQGAIAIRYHTPPSGHAFFLFRGISHSGITNSEEYLASNQVVGSSNLSGRAKFQKKSQLLSSDWLLLCLRPVGISVAFTTPFVPTRPDARGRLAEEFSPRREETGVLVPNPESNLPTHSEDERTPFESDY
jgi:hypothetical protein